MNKVYDVKYKDDGVYYPVGGENRSKAIINYLYYIGENPSDFIHYRANLAKDYEGVNILTEKEGLLDMEELMPKGYNTWWGCGECGEEDCFDYVPIDKYKCSACGYVGGIPFAE